MLEAAAQGLGIAVMHASHYNEAQDSRLARLFPETRVESPYRYYFVCRPRALQTRAVRIFRDWLVGADI
jgi:LysR family glycine cleavage system transcriptional activator